MRESNQYATAKQREQGRAFKNMVNDKHDRWAVKYLTKLGLSPEWKNTHSFQVTVNGRKGMYYCGRDEKIRFNDGEVVEFGELTLEEYLQKPLDS